jgi:glucokinase
MAFVGIDIGGTRIKLGLVKDAELIGSSVFEVVDNQSLAANLPLILKQIIDLKNTLDNTLTIEGIGMALPCLVDHKSNKIISDYVKYPDAKSLDLTAWCKNNFKADFSLENDARAALIGEIQSFSKMTKDAVMVTFGTGVGTAVLSNGHILRGFNQFAGNLGGHQTIDFFGEPCNCGDIGCAESVASGWSLLGMLKKEKLYKESSLSNIENPQIKDLFEAAAVGDLLAKLLYQKILLAWAYTLKNMVYAFDPEYLILGGGVMVNGENLRKYFQDFLNNAGWLSPFGVKVVLAKNPDWAGVIGAAILAQEKAERH